MEARPGLARSVCAARIEFVKWSPPGQRRRGDHSSVAYRISPATLRRLAPEAIDHWVTPRKSAESAQKSDRVIGSFCELRGISGDLSWGSFRRPEKSGKESLLLTLTFTHLHRYLIHPITPHHLRN